TTIIGNERNKLILQRLLERGNIASTFIFAGPEGVGKRQFALTMAKAANCQRAPSGRFAGDSCDHCPVCRRIDEAAYGDVTTVVPDGQSIKIAQTRALTEEVYYRPREGRQRFFIIDEAERLRDEAANSLLKTLEEPPPTSTIILLTARPDALLQTIRSRAQRLTFVPIPLREIEDYLARNYPRPPAETQLLARLTEGRIGQATAFDLSLYRQERRALLGMIELMAAGDDLFRLLKAAEYLGKKEKDEFEKSLTLLVSLLRDLFLLAAGGSRDALTNIDISERLEELAAVIGLQRLIGWVEKFDELRARLKININRTIATEATLLEAAGNTK
ncbi:MAG: DNA polymerase III subunit delta', partial [Blastocatellia bacterium]|nr:DNA polymerase III subunit delta' [Blastocatellia bacterium]